MADSNEALKSAVDVAKQIITLSTGVMALSITFWEKLQGGGKDVGVVLGLAWMLLLVAIGFGLITLLAITGTYHRLERIKAGELPAHTPSPGAMDDNIRNPALVMVASFGAGLLLLAVAAWNRAPPTPPAGSQGTSVVIQQSFAAPACPPVKAEPPRKSPKGRSRPPTSQCTITPATKSHGDRRPT